MILYLCLVLLHLIDSKGIHEYLIQLFVENSAGQKWLPLILRKGGRALHHYWYYPPKTPLSSIFYNTEIVDLNSNWWESVHEIHSAYVTEFCLIFAFVVVAIAFSATLTRALGKRRNLSPVSLFLDWCLIRGEFPFSRNGQIQIIGFCINFCTKHIKNRLENSIHSIPVCVYGFTRRSTMATGESSIPLWFCFLG